MEEIITKYTSLRKRRGRARDGENWTLENIKDGLNYFYELNQRYPTLPEIDKFDYLPTSRTIQRSFGGLIKLRSQLALSGPVNFNSGEIRSKIAGELWNQARLYEEAFYKFLINQVPEVRVHEHKIIRPGGITCDFFIYTSDKDGVVLDLFYAQDLFSLSKVVSIKNKRYVNLPFVTFFILVGNDSITQEQIDKQVANRKNRLLDNTHVITERNFKTNFMKFLQYRKIG